VTNRKLVHGDFIEQLERAIESGCDAILLREKDLDEKEYERLAAQVLAVCKEYKVPCILHAFEEVASRLAVNSLHMSYVGFLNLSSEQKSRYTVLGVSIHSVEEAINAYQAGATYLTAGHVFATDCKKGVPPRGLDFLHTICSAVPIPVYAIGGIHEKNAMECIRVGAAGVCMMSSYMKC
jgi:thiamine-phosphate pyrophosphorylase